MQTGSRDYAGAGCWSQHTHLLTMCYLGPEPIQLYGGRQSTARFEVQSSFAMAQAGVSYECFRVRLRDRGVNDQGI
jgi:hypothetical protein